MVKSLIISVLTSLLFIMGVGAASATTTLTPCVHEDCSIGTNADGSTIYQDGYWDGATQSNGTGGSYYMLDGVATYTTEPIVQSCTEGYGLAEDGSCLPLGYWDTTEPTELAPATETTATDTAYIAPATVPAAPVVADTMPADVAGAAWMMFDATGAASLLPNHDTRVELIGHNKTGFPYLTANMITVWDMQGNHYLFSF